MEWVVNATPWSLYPWERYTVGWAPETVWTGAENLARTEIRFPDRPTCNESLYRLIYTASCYLLMGVRNWLLEGCTLQVVEQKELKKMYLDLRRTQKLNAV